MSDLVNELHHEIETKLQLSPNMPDGIDDLRQLIQNLIYSYMPDMVLAHLEDFQNEQRQSYKSCCDSLRSENENLNHEVDDLKSKMSVLEMQYEKFKSLNENFFGTAKEIVEGIRANADCEMIVQDIKCYDCNGNLIATESDKMRHYSEDDFSVAPAVYENHRPSWFSPLLKEFNQKNVAAKTADHTKKTFFDQILFWKKIAKLNEPDETKAKVIDFERRKKITALLNSNLSNEEKYVKYMLLTPGISKDFLKTLTGAEELGLDANVIITYLEQPSADFNKEVFEAYVSQVHKGTDFNLKKEFANDLIRGDWYVTSSIRGKEQKWKFVPEEELEELRIKIESVTAILTDMQAPSLAAPVPLASNYMPNHDGEADNTDLPPVDMFSEEEIPDFDDEEAEEMMGDIYDG